MTVRRHVLQSRGWEDVRGHGAQTRVLAAPQETPACVLPNSNNDTTVHPKSAGRRDPPLPAPRYLGLTPDHPPPHCPRAGAAPWSGIPLNRSLERGDAGVMGVRSADPAWAQCCWGQGTHRARAAWGGGLRTQPAPLGQTPSHRGSQSCPGTAPSLTPQVSGGTQGQAERGCPCLGRAELVGRKLLSHAHHLAALPTHPTAPQLQGPWARGLQGGSLGWGPGQRALQMCPPSGTHTHLSR